MAENETGADDRTEEATPERRDDFRERGQVVVSREATSVMVLAGSVIFFTAAAPSLLQTLMRLFTTTFESIATRRITQENVLTFAGQLWQEALILTLPAFVVTMVVASASTLAQTRMNWSWERVKPDFSRLNPFSGVMKMFTMQTVVELLKSVAKMVVVGTVAYLILYAEWVKVPELMTYPMVATWTYWAKITKNLFWGVAGFLSLVAAADWFYNFMSYERQIKMTKQEVKEEFKRREVDPHVKGRMRRMQREAAQRKTIEKTRTATVLITNPTHYSIALKYELGDPAPILVAKGVDFLALRMREAAKEEKIPIIENRPLARELYATVEEGEEIPDKLYKAVAEIIRYVFKLKGRRIPTKKTTPNPEART